ARARLLELVADLDDARWMGPRLPIVNPIRWEIAHVAWFQERWVLRHARNEEPLRADGDALYDSSAVAHDVRWDLPLPSRAEPLVFDNEKWAHPVDVRAFRIARACVTNAEYAAFVDDRGYERRELWSDDGWAWRASAEAKHPVYWQRGARGEWLVRRFDVVG